MGGVAGRPALAGERRRRREGAPMIASISARRSSTCAAVARRELLALDPHHVRRRPARSRARGRRSSTCRGRRRADPSGAPRAPPPTIRSNAFQAASTRAASRARAGRPSAARRSCSVTWLGTPNSVPPPPRQALDDVDVDRVRIERLAGGLRDRRVARGVRDQRLDRRVLGLARAAPAGPVDRGRERLLLAGLDRDRSTFTRRRPVARSREARGRARPSGRRPGRPRRARRRAPTRRSRRRRRPSRAPGRGPAG